MNKTITATFDGRAFYPDVPVDLQPNTRYVITIQGDFPKADGGDAWDVLEKLTGTFDAPEDWAAEHDHYLYGSPKGRTRAVHEI